MSTFSTFVVPAGRPAEIEDASRDRSGSVADFVLNRIAPLERPVSVARVLRGAGLSLSEAHQQLNRIVADEQVRVRLRGDLDALVGVLRDLGVQAVRKG